MTDFERFDRPDEHQEPVFDTEALDTNDAAGDAVVCEGQADGYADIDDNGLAEEHAGPVVIEIGPIPADQDVFDTYEDFEEVFPQHVRDLVADSALDGARLARPDIEEDDLLVSGFGDAPTEESLAETDQRKIDRASSASKGLRIGEEYDGIELDTAHGYEGDDSNLSNITEREVQELRNEKQAIAKQLSDAEQGIGISSTARAEATARLAELNSQIAGLQETQAEQAGKPVYYATRLSELRENMPEDNPLAYIGDIPGKGHIAVYDRRSLVEAGVPISEKSPQQIRIAVTGAELMRHCVAIIPIEIGDQDQDA